MGGVQTVFAEGFYGMFSPPMSFQHPIVFLWYSARAESITKLILKRADPVIFKIFSGMNSFRLIPIICPARKAQPEMYWKTTIKSRRGLSRDKSKTSETNSWKYRRINQAFYADSIAQYL